MTSEGQAAPPKSDRLLRRVSDRVTRAAGLESLEAEEPRKMFASVFKLRRDEELESYFTAGTRETTPDIGKVDTRWPQPWAFVQFFLFALAVYLAFTFAAKEFPSNPIMIPGLMVVGAFVVPASLLVFFYEVNVPRNVSIYQLMKLVLLGGIMSIVVSLFLFRATNLSSWLGASAAGIIEETGKGLVLLLVVYKARFRWSLNGLAFGAAIGTGFAAFESAGYAFTPMIQALATYSGTYGVGTAYQIGYDAMTTSIRTRGIYTILGGHVVWTAMVGAALWRVRGDRKFSPSMVLDPKFLRIFAFSVILHMIWNAPFGFPITTLIDLKYIALGFVGWLVVIALIQDGLKQVRNAKASALGQPVAQALATGVPAPMAPAPAAVAPPSPPPKPKGSRPVTLLACGHCGAKLRAGDAFCLNCGQAVACRQCGEPLGVGAKACTACGAPTGA